MKKIVISLITLFLFLSCANIKPLRSLENNPIPRGLNQEQIDRAFLEAGRSDGWVIQKSKANSFIGKLFVRSHYVEIAIDIEKEAYSVIYNDSRNMKYDPKMNYIHRNYYRWVTNLIADINRGLSIESAKK